MTNPKDKKTVILQLLEKEKQPVALKELLQKLDRNYSERSLRRWLKQLIDNGLVEKIGSKRATKYQLFVSSSVNLPSSTFCFSNKSKSIIEKLHVPVYDRFPATYAHSWLEQYQPNKTFYLPAACRKELYQIGKRSRDHDPAGTYAHRIFNRLLIDLSYNSCRLEGNTYSLLETQKLLLEGKEVQGKLDQEKTMILNHKEAIRYLVNNASKLMVDMTTICTLHYLLADGLVDSDDMGQLRKCGVRIGGSSYMPIENTKQLAGSFRSIINKAALIQDSYEQSLFLLIHITYLQGFIDVNKRTARLSANISLITNNLVPQSFNDVARSEYISAMIAVYEFQNINPILDLYIFSYKRTCRMYDATVESLGFDEVRVRYRQQRRALLHEIIVNEIFGDKLVKYVAVQTKKIALQEDRVDFEGDVWEDLRDISLARIVGLGVTPAELNKWVKLAHPLDRF